MTVINMDCRAGMATMPANSFDSIVTDPPYGLSKQPKIREVLKHWLAGDDYTATGGGFMGKSWDSFVPGPLTWAEAYRVLKPGGYIACFAGSRTVDLMSMSLRLGGFEVVDMCHWLYGSGFPKSMNLQKATGSDEWEGWGTALKPAHEPIIIARKPLDGTYANNILTHGVGGLNISGCRVGSEEMQRTASNGQKVSENAAMSGGNSSIVAAG
ncbi:MAG: site-specific DNA-methyltransferase, partial [Gammaproteobacteria bacterium]|nr:site-specific DNA-methyltransferase [Gammaproteobacteria bacterium]